jgi:hypothetical protein
MKKIVLTAAIAFSTLFALANPDEVNAKVLSAFKTEFSSATDVVWTIGVDYFRATFNYNDKHEFAYYNLNGELMGLTRYVTIAEVPMNLQSDLKKNFAAYWITDLFEVANSEGTSYYVTVENSDSRIILKSTDAKYWRSFQKTKKS